MPVLPHQFGSPMAHALGSLGLSAVRVENPMVTLRAAHFRNALLKVGLPIPFFLVHDVGLLFAADASDVPIGLRPGMKELGMPPEFLETFEAYAAALREIAASEVVERARAWRLADPLITIVLLKVLGPIFDQHVGRGSYDAPLPLDPEVYRDLEAQVPQLFRDADRRDESSFLRHIARHRLRLITGIEQVDLDTLRLLGMFGAEAGAANALGMVDVLSVLQTPEANDIVNFSLDLLPSVLETKRASGQQVFSVDGYSGVSRVGTIDSLVLSELAFDPELFARRFLEREVFYYARDKQTEEERRIHYIVIDATASMRGQRAVFARGLALTLVKKLLLRGEDVYVRFFDSRLYDAMHARPSRTGTGGINVPYVLSFQGERGRNYQKVFGLLANDIDRLATRERRTPILYLLTHAECHIPVETVERLRSIAQLYGVFMLPSTGELELDYLDRLHTVQVVDADQLSHGQARNQRALAIVADAARD